MINSLLEPYPNPPCDPGPTLDYVVNVTPLDMARMRDMYTVELKNFQEDKYMNRVLT